MKRNISRVDISAKGTVAVIFNQAVTTKGGDRIKSEQSDKCDKPAHKSLKNAFQRLIPHLMYSTELFVCDNSSDKYLKEWGFLDDEVFAGVTVTGVKIVGDMDGVKLIGRKETTKGDVINIISPIIWFDNEAEDRYTFVVYLNELVGDLLVEAQKYLDGKYAEVPQTEMELI